MKKVIFSMLMLGMVACAMVGCRASGEIGDTSSLVGGAR
jgi:hypothetical protein